MSKFLERYLLLMFLVVNMTAEYILLTSISKIAFYVVLTLSLPFLFKPEVTSPIAKKKFPELSLLIVIYIVCQFVFQLAIISFDNILFTISKCAIFSILMLCVTKNFEFYSTKILKVIPYVILLLISVGWVYNKVNIFGNITFGFVNGNVAGTLATVGFAGFLFKDKKINRIDNLLCAVFLMVTILVGGCRNAFVMCVIIIMIRYGLSFRLILFGIISLVVMMYIMPSLGLEVTGLERIVGTINGTVDIDRDAEKEAAWIMINEKPISGWGHYYGNSDAARQFSEYNAHNGYLSMIENMGWPCGLLVLFCLVWGSLKRIKLYFLKNNVINFHLAVVFSTLFAANQEDYLGGVNQCTTNLFFMSFAVLSLIFYNYKNNLPLPTE